MADSPRDGFILPKHQSSVLLVDNRSSGLLSLRTALDDLPLKIVEAASGEQAVELVQSHDFSVVILDVMMPEASGLQTAQSIRHNERTQKVPIIFITDGDMGQSEIEAAYNLGAVDILVNPLHPLAVQSKVRALVELSQEREQASEEAEQLKLLINSSTEYAIFQLDPSGYIMTWNAGAQRIKGYQPEEIVGQHFSKFYPQDSIDSGWPDHELQVAKQQGRFEDEGWRIKKDGSRFWANVIITALHDKEGTLVGFSKITRDLTARKEAEENARRLITETTARRVSEENAALIEKQRERLHVTLASIGDAVISTDAQGRVEYLNPVAEELTGWESSQAVGLPLTQIFIIVNETTRKPVDNPALRAIREGAIVGLANHTILIAKDGTERPIDDSAAPIKSTTGELIGCVLVFRDVTKHRAAQRAILESELRYRLVGEVANDAIWDWDLITNDVVWNEGVRRAFGYSMQEVGAKASWWIENIHPDDRQRISDHIHDAIDSGQENWQNEYRYRRADDTYASVFDRGRIVHQDGKPVRMVGSMLDLTERKQAEAELKAAEDRFAFVRNSSGVGFWYCDLPFDELQWDDLVKEHFHLPKDARVTIETFYDRIHPEDRQPTRSAIERSIAEHDSYDVFYRTMHPESGIQKWVRAIGRTTYDDDDSPIRFDGVTLDVTDQKNTESELREVAAALSEAGHRKDEFLATLAHELRNPLAPMWNSLQLMRMSNDPTLLANSLDLIERQLSQMVRLVDDLMDVSRITRGKVDLRKERVPISEIVNSAIETCRPLIEQMKHTLDVSLPAQPIVVNVDSTRIAQVFANLLNNAAKYSELGGRISLTVAQDADDVEVRVKDTGIGIAAEQLHRIFDLFTQVDQSLEKSRGGLGIGLTLVKRLVELHNGVVEARSAGLNQGSEFIVRIPIASQSQATAAAASGSGSFSKTSFRILVVDDNRDGAESIAMVLKIGGNETRTAYDGQQGVQVAEAYRPDVILFDIGLPRINGYEACRLIRQQAWGKDVVIIAVTGWGQEEDLRRSKEAGFDHHLVKPVEPRALLQLISSLPRK